MVERLDEIKKILLQMKADTLKEISKAVKSTADVTTGEPSGDIYDQASSERDRELGLLLGDREREKLVAIQEALERIEDGSYGICESCESDIAPGRLEALPFTRLCVSCQSDREKEMKQSRRFDDERAYRKLGATDVDEDNS